MKLATTTGDFAAYTSDQCESLQYIHDVGFRYADYNFGMGIGTGKGIALPDWKKEIEKSFPGFKLRGEPLSLSIGCHIGPGSLAIACSKITRP